MSTDVVTHPEVPAPAEAAARPLDELRFHRLLVAIDGSVNADQALSAAVSASRHQHASVTLLAVSPDVQNDAARWAVGGVVNPVELQQGADDYAERVLKDACARLPGDVPVRTLFRRGKAGPEIVRASEEEPYDAILVGARGLGRVGALVGSVSEYVLHHAKCAVVVAHAPREESAAA